MMNTRQAKNNIGFYELLASRGVQDALQNPSSHVMLESYRYIYQQVGMLVNSWNGFTDEAQLVLETIRELLEEEREKA